MLMVEFWKQKLESINSKFKRIIFIELQYKIFLNTRNKIKNHTRHELVWYKSNYFNFFSQLSTIFFTIWPPIEKTWCEESWFLLFLANSSAASIFNFSRPCRASGTNILFFLDKIIISFRLFYVFKIIIYKSCKGIVIK